MSTPNQDAAGVQVVTDALKRWRDLPPIEIRIGRWEAYILVCVLQLAVRHPELEGRTEEIVIDIGRQLQNGVADDPEVYTVLEAGWNPALDVEQAPAECVPELIDGTYQGCGSCSACQDQRDTADQEAEESDEVMACGEGMCRCYCTDRAHPCGCDCPRDADGELIEN